MRLITRIQIVLFVVLAAATPMLLRGEVERPVEQVLTLDQSLQRALQNNQQLLMTQNDIRIAEQRVSEAKSQYFPQLGVNLNGSRYLSQQGFILPAEFGSTFMRPSRELESDNFYSARTYLRQPLYNGGRTRNIIRLAEANLERARIQFDAERIQVVYNVEKAFNDVLLRQKEIKLYEETAADVEKMGAQIPAADMNRHAELENIQNRLRRQLSEKYRLEDKARLEFLSALGLELYTTVRLQGEFKIVAIGMDLPKLLARAQESRSEIRRTDFQKEIDRLAVNLSLSERYPVVAFGAAYELNDPTFPLNSTSWNATLNVSLPLFDGFSSRSRIRQKRLQSDQSRVQRTEIEDSINLDVRESYADFIYWQKERIVREQELRRAESSDASLGRSKDVVDRLRSRVWLLEAQEAYWESVHAQGVARAKLEKAVGRSLTE